MTLKLVREEDADPYADEWRRLHEQFGPTVDALEDAMDKDEPWAGRVAPDWFWRRLFRALLPVALITAVAALYGLCSLPR